MELYRKETKAPFVPRTGDNFDANYCGRVDEFDKHTYDFYLSKVNSEKHFIDFYYNENDYMKIKEVSFEYEGKTYRIVNLHDEQYYDNPTGLKDKKTTSAVTNNSNIKGMGDISMLSQIKEKEKTEKEDSNKEITDVTPPTHRKTNL